MIRKSFEIVNIFFVLLSIFVCFLKTGVSFLFLLTIGASYPFYMRFCSFWCKHCTLFLTKWNPHGTRLGMILLCIFSVKIRFVHRNRHSLAQLPLSYNNVLYFILACFPRGTRLPIVCNLTAGSISRLLIVACFKHQVK